jgi:molybdenum cofactor guanylyltransferase
MTLHKKQMINMTYFAALREICGLSNESVETDKIDAAGLYQELKKRFNWPLEQELVMVAANNEYVDMHYVLKAGDNIVFIPPVAGG